MRGSPISSKALKRSALAASLAFVLAIPFIGVRLDYTDAQNSLAYRPLGVLVAVIVAFVGRLAFEVWTEHRPSLSGFAALTASLPKPNRSIVTIAGYAVLGLAFAFPFAPFATRYELDLAATFLTYVMLGWGLNIVVGLAGLLDLGYVAFYAAGAYTFGILATNFGIGFWAALPLSGLVAATLGVLLGFPVLRLKGDYLAIVTLGFGEIIRIVLINWADLTGGPNGISGIPRPSFFGATFAVSADDGGTTFAQLFGIPFSPVHRVAWVYYVILALALATLVLTRRLRRLPIGRAWEALREDETACQALGLNPTLIKLTAFALGAMIGGFAGCFFAARLGFISPESFTFSESAVILAIVVLGGMGSNLGIAIAAAVLVGLPEIGRNFAEYRMLLFGLAMVLIMVWRPRGLVSGRSPSVSVDIGLFPSSATVGTVR